MNALIDPRTMQDNLGEAMNAARDDREPMTPEDLETFVDAVIVQASNYCADAHGDFRLLAQSFYDGDLFGNEEEGRSQIVMTEVRDTILAMMPSLMRVLAGSERTAFFAPAYPDTGAWAKQATDYICDTVMMTDNPGWRVIHDAVKDALLKRIGIIKWWREESKKTSEADIDGLDYEQIMLLRSDPTVHITSMVPAEPFTDPETGEVIPLFDCHIRRVFIEQKHRIAAVPPEEFIYTPDAKSSMAGAGLAWGHRRMIRASEAVAMGIDPDLVDELSSAGDYDQFAIDPNGEALARNPRQWGATSFSDPASYWVEYVELFVHVDADGDGIAELRRICTLGEAHQIVHNEIVDDVQFAVFTPDITPHLLAGQASSEQTMDLQQINSAVTRAMLDSLNQSIRQRLVVLANQVNMKDVLNSEIGGIIRATAANAVQALDTPFVGAQALPVLEKMGEIKSARTGVTKASQGLDPDVLQSTTKAAVLGTQAAAEQRLEFVARTLAETGMRPLMRGLLRQVIKHTDRPRQVLAGKRWVPVDPRYWSSEMQVTVDVGRGMGKPEETIALLSFVLSEQKAILASMGPANPLVSLEQFRNTLEDILRAGRIRDVGRYFGLVDKQQEAQLKQQEAQKVDPNLMLAQAETMKAQAQAQKATLDYKLGVLKEQTTLAQKQAELAHDRDKTMASNILVQRRLNLDYAKLVADVHMEEEKLRVDAVKTVGEAIGADEQAARDREDKDLAAIESSRAAAGEAASSGAASVVQEALAQAQQSFGGQQGPGGEAALELKQATAALQEAHAGIAQLAQMIAGNMTQSPPAAPAGAPALPPGGM